ncbi:MAG: phenylalanyl-tRNA synthetase beta chain, partial [Maribacter sp.]
SLDIKVKNVTESGMGLSVPPYRVDVQRQVDVIEEILRVYGYNNVNFSEKLNASVASTSPFEDHKVQYAIGNLLAAKGCYEILTNSLTSPEYITLLEDESSAKKEITLVNPLSGDLSILRKNSIFSALEVAAYNINRKKQNLKLFEFGKTYHTYNGNRIEEKYLSILLSGANREPSWAVSSETTGFFQMKSIVETVLSKLGIKNSASQPDSSGLFTEGLALTKGPMTLVTFGVVKKAILKRFDIKQEILFANFNWDIILKVMNKKEVVFSEISKYPEVKRDFALLLDQSVTFKEVYDIAYKNERKLLRNISLFDVYEGDKLPEGKKSYAVSFTIQDDNKTLTDKQIEKIMSKLQRSYENELNAELR